MAIIKTHLYRILFDKSEIINGLLALNKIGDIYPVEANKVVNNVKGVACLDLNNPYSKLLDDLKEISDDLSLVPTKYQDKIVDFDISKTNTFINDLKSKIIKIKSISDKLEEEKDENQGAIKLLKHLQALDISLDDLKNTGFIKLRFGSIPKDSLARLDYYDKVEFVYQIIEQTNQDVWLIYLATNEHIVEVDNIFYSMNFHEYEVPEFVHGSIKDALVELKEESKAMTTNISHMQDKLDLLKQEYGKELNQTFGLTKILKEIYDNNIYVVDYSNKAAIYVFSSLLLEEVEDKFKGLGDLTILELPTTILQEQGIEPPLLVDNHNFFKPFEIIIPNKNNDNFDATIWVGIITLFTCFMFLGDLGLALISLGITVFTFLSKNQDLKRLMIRITGVILLGGLTYGTFFFKEIYHTPFDSAFKSIHSFIFFGVVSLVCYIVLHIVKLFTKEKKLF